MAYVGVSGSDRRAGRVYYFICHLYPMMQKIKLILAKKYVFIPLLILVIGGGYWYTKSSGNKETVRYVLAQVTKGSVVTTVTGSGQVSGEQQIEIKPEVAGDITSIVVKSGDEVKAGDVLMTIDGKTAVKAVRDASLSVHDAELSLAAAKLSLKELTDPPDELKVTQAENTLNKAKRDLEDLKKGANAYELRKAEQSVESAEEKARLTRDGSMPQDVRDAYDDASSDIATMLQTFQDALDKADAVLGIDEAGKNDAYERYISGLNTSLLSKSTLSYYAAKASLKDFKAVAEDLKLFDEETAKIDTALAEALTCVEKMEALLTDVEAALKYSITSSSFTQSSLDSLKSSISSARTSVSSKTNVVSSARHAIEDAQTSYADAGRSLQTAKDVLQELKDGPDASELASAEEKVKEAELSLKDLMAGATASEITNAQQSIAQRQSSLESARNTLGDKQEELASYTVRAPFDGRIADVTATVYGKASASESIATLFTKSKITEITLNEVDIAKVKVGQRATLTFDAVSDMTIVGTVAEVDEIGTVSQGVVSYGVKIAFETEGDTIKPGMSASAAIVTNASVDVLTVENAAIQTDVSGASTVSRVTGVDASTALSTDGVELSNDPEIVQVATGLSNDELTEISSGLSEGDYVIVRTVQGSSATTKTSAATNASRGSAAGGMGGVMMMGTPPGR